MTAKTAVGLACSFCLKPTTEVQKLVAGPGVYICDGCVALAAQVIEESPETKQPADGVHDLGTWDLVTTPEQVLENLPRVAAAGAQVERDLTGWVRRGRDLGLTWARIGEALGMARQSAWERFSGEE